MLSGHLVALAISLATRLGIPDLVARGPRRVSALARATRSHPDTLYRILRALAAVGVFAERRGRRFARTPLSDLLRPGVRGSLHAPALLAGESWRRVAYDLPAAVRSGRSPLPARARRRLLRVPGPSPGALPALSRRHGVSLAGAGARGRARRPPHARPLRRGRGRRPGGADEDDSGDEGDRHRRRARGARRGGARPAQPGRGRSGPAMPRRRRRFLPERSARRRRLRPRLRPAQLGRSPRGEDPGALSGRDGRRRAPPGGRNARARRRPPAVAQVHDLEMLVFTDGRERTAAEYRALLRPRAFACAESSPLPAAPASSKPCRSILV